MRAFGATAQNPEESRIVRQAVAERLMAQGFDRRVAARMAEGSYRRVEAMIEEEERNPGAAGRNGPRNRA